MQTRLFQRGERAGGSDLRLPRAGQRVRSRLWDGALRAGYSGMCDRGMVPRQSHWQLTPKQSIELECARRGRGQLVSGCVALLRRQDVDDDLMIALGGPAAQGLLDSGPRQAQLYWLRVWAARGLLHAYADQAEDAVIEALSDEHWRVREMAAKVIARYRVAAAFEQVTALRADPVPRVRAAADRALVLLTAVAS
jgi:HEAT repeat protein